MFDWKRLTTLVIAGILITSTAAFADDNAWGTNLRTYNPDTGAWEIAWAAQALNGLMHISAQQDDDGNMNMDILKPEQNPPRRIRFYAPDDGGWNWVMETSFDEGETWTEVYKIRATPWVDSA